MPETQTTSSTSVKDEEKKEKKDPMQEKYGELDGRWLPMIEGDVFYVLDTIEYKEQKPTKKDGEEPDPNAAVVYDEIHTYVVQYPDGKREELDQEEFDERNYQFVSPAKLP